MAKADAILRAKPAIVLDASASVFRPRLWQMSRSKPGDLRYNVAVRFEMTFPRDGVWRLNEAKRNVVAAPTLERGGRSFFGRGLKRSAAEPATPRKVDFNFQVRPILSDKCFKCHGPDPRNRKAGLRLDTRKGHSRTPKSGGHAIVPGNLEESELVTRITAEDETERMPPQSLGRTLLRAEIELLKRVGQRGRRDGRTTGRSLPPVDLPRPRSRSPPGPETRSTGSCWPGSRPRDSRSSPEAGKERLIRRVTFDLTGLPPTVAEVDAFLADRQSATPTSGWSTGCWLRRGSASGWPWTGSTWRATPTPTAIRPTSTAPSGRGATGSSRRSTRICRTTSSSPGSSPATCCRIRRATQVLATAFNRHHRQTNEGGSDRRGVARRVRRRPYEHLRSRVPGADARVRPLPQSQVRSDHPEGLLSLFSFFNSIDESGLYSHFTDAVPTPTLLLTTRRKATSIAEIERRIKARRLSWSALAARADRMFEAWLRGLHRERQAAPIPRSDR